MKYLVTGGAGFIGSALCKRLTDDGHRVTAFDNISRGHWERFTGYEDSVERLEGDIRDEAAVYTAAQSQDAIIHLAYLQGTQTFYAEPRQVLSVALRGILNVLTACELNGISDLLLVSSSEAYQVAPVVPTPEDIPLVVPDVLNARYSYGGGKIASELATLAWQRTGVLDRAIIARPHNVIGPDMGKEHVVPEFCIRMNSLVLQHPDGVIPFPIQGTGEETRSFCYVDDCVSQLAALLEQAPVGPSVWHLGTMDERTIADVAHEVARCYKREIKVMPGTLPKGSPPRRLPDTAKVDALGAKSTVGFSKAIAQTVRWYKEHG